MSQLVAVLVLNAVYSRASIQLRAQQLVRLHESVQLLGQVTVLSLEDLRVSRKGLLLGAEVLLLSAVLPVLLSLAIHVTSSSKQGILKRLELALGVPDLVAQVGVAALQALKLLLRIVVLGSNAVVVPSQSGNIS